MKNEENFGEAYRQPRYKYLLDQNRESERSLQQNQSRQNTKNNIIDDFTSDRGNQFWFRFFFFVSCGPKLHSRNIRQKPQKKVQKSLPSKSSEYVEAF